MSNAITPSLPPELLIVSKDGLDISLIEKTTTFDYYESILSPMITASISYVDTGNSVHGNYKTDTQERIGTIYNSLPLTSGEEVKFVVNSHLGKLDFSNKPLVVNSSTNLGGDSSKEVVVLSLVSKDMETNLNTPINEKYKNLISSSVSNILKRTFDLDNSDIDIEETKHNYSFIGAGRSPYEIMIELAKKATSKSGSPGYFFYQTQDGYKFKSIDNLVNSEPKDKYFTSNAIRSSLTSDIDNNKRIINYSVSRNQNLIDAMKSGVYISRNIFFNPRDLSYTEIIFNINQDQPDFTLGTDIAVPPGSKSYIRTNQHILDVGFYEAGANIKDVSTDPAFSFAKATMRYNILFSQLINMNIPCNPNLKAGDVIECNFEKITTGSKSIGAYDETQSGNYLIVNLCHHFDTDSSYTALTLVRDSYGIYNIKK